MLQMQNGHLGLIESWGAFVTQEMVLAIFKLRITEPAHNLIIKRSSKRPTPCRVTELGNGRRVAYRKIVTCFVLISFSAISKLPR